MNVVNQSADIMVNSKPSNRSSANNTKTVLVWTTPGDERDFNFVMATNI